MSRPGICPAEIGRDCYASPSRLGTAQYPRRRTLSLPDGACVQCRSADEKEDADEEGTKDSRHGSGRSDRSELTPRSASRYGGDNVVAAGHRTKPSAILEEAGAVRDRGRLCPHRPGARDRSLPRLDTIYHMAAILSAAGEKNPALAWSVNMDGLRNVLEVSRSASCVRSSFRARSRRSARDPRGARSGDGSSSQDVYGVTKVAGELLGDYYARKLGVDVRGLRYPGIISSVTPPSGGTTDYAVEIFYRSRRGQALHLLPT